MTGRRAQPDRRRSERQVISYLAFTGVLLALGVDIALPAFDEIRPSFGLAPQSSRITLIITLYLVGMGVGQLLWGPIADRFGRLVAMNMGVGLYVAGALGSAFAPSLGGLFVARALWGLGAAAPAGLRPAIARDLYSGNQMARIMSLVMAIFMIGPVVSPLIGEAILSVGTWPWVFILCAMAGGGHLVWSRWFGETLDPELRQPLEFSTTARAFRRVITTRQTMGHTLAYGFSSASFFIFLASAQPIMDNIYGRADQFVLAFGAAGIAMAGAFIALDRILKRHGARTTSMVAMKVFVVLAILHLSVVVLAAGRPPFGVWISFIIVINLFATPLGPSCFSLGLEPMGELAGTAAGVMGFCSTIMGSILAAVVDARIGSTVTPMAIAYLLYGVLTLLSLWWADPQRVVVRSSSNIASRGWRSWRTVFSVDRRAVGCREWPGPSHRGEESVG